MIIVFAVDYLSPETNGLVMSTNRMIRSLRKRGHTVRVLACGATGKDAYPLEERLIPLVSYIARKQKVIFAKYDESTVRAALDGADVLHILMPFRLSYKLIRRAQQLGIPTTAGFHVHPENITRNIGFKHTPKCLINLVFWTWRIHLYDKVAAIHCPSDFIAGELAKRRYRAKLYSFSNGVSEEFRPIRKDRDSNKFKILMIARLAAEKRHDLLIRAVARSKYEHKIQIAFATGGGPMRWVLERLSKFYLLNQPTFRFYSPTELNQEINKSDLYVHAADIEIEGISCLEAMSGGLVPLIAQAKKSATKQFIINPHCGFEAGSVKDLAAKIDWFIEHPAERKKIRSKYLKYARQFNIKYTVVAMEGMLKYAIDKKA